MSTLYSQPGVAPPRFLHKWSLALERNWLPHHTPHSAILPSELRFLWTGIRCAVLGDNICAPVGAIAESRRAKSFLKIQSSSRSAKARKYLRSRRGDRARGQLDMEKGRSGHCCLACLLCPGAGRGSRTHNPRFTKPLLCH